MAARPMNALAVRHPALRDLAGRWAVPALGALGAMTATYVVVSPNGKLLKLVWLLAALAIALLLRAEIFLPLITLGFAVSTAFTAPVVPSLPIPLYFADFLAALVAIRAALPRQRNQRSARLRGTPTALFLAWALVMALASIRGMNAGVDIQSALRGNLALVYWPILYLGFSRTLRERFIDHALLWRNLALVVCGLAGWGLIARALNIQFNDSGLALVATGDTTTINRNYGFAGAFIVYPVLALGGIAGMGFGGMRRRTAIAIAAVGTVATLLTFVRGEIFSLAFASVVLLLVRPVRSIDGARLRTALQLGLTMGAVVLGLVLTSPTLGYAIVQRALPFTHQAPGAKANAEYRQKAVTTGIRFAKAHPAGLGVLNTTRLDAEHIDRGYLAHSGVATLLLFGGWPALGLAILTVLALIRRSFIVPAQPQWAHPAFVGVILLLSTYSISAAGLAGDPWVVPLGALAVALRFTLADVIGKRVT